MASTFGTSGGGGSRQTDMRARRLQNLAAGTAAQLETKLDKLGGDISGNLTVEGLTTLSQVGIGTSNPISILNIKGTLPRLTIGDDRDRTWTVDEPVSSIDFTGDDTSSGGATNTLRARIQMFIDQEVFGRSYGLSFHSANIVDGVVREHIRMSSLGAMTIGMSRQNQTQLRVRTTNVGSPLYGIMLDDIYNGTAPNYIGFSSVGSGGASSVTGSIGSTASNKSGPDAQITGTIDLSTKNSTDASPVLRVQVKPTGQVNFTPLATDPSPASAGDVYYNSATNKLRVHNGTTFVDLH